LLSGVLYCYYEWCHASPWHDLQEGIPASQVKQELASMPPGWHGPSAKPKAGQVPRQFVVTVSTSASTRVDFDLRGLDEVVRASFHYYNTCEQVDHFIAALSYIRAQHID
jgi:selenocysteine lyase/cysteine desulfurase